MKRVFRNATALILLVFAVSCAALAVSCGARRANGDNTAAVPADGTVSAESGTETERETAAEEETEPYFDSSGDFDGFYIKKTSKNKLDGDIALTNAGAMVYRAFIPGGADADECRLYWKGALFSGGKEVLSGKEKIPAPGECTEYTVHYKGADRTVRIETYRGSDRVLPVFIEDCAEKISLEGKTVVDFATLDDVAKNSEKAYYYTCTAHIGGDAYFASLKGRGNSSWYEAQRSFNIRFYKDCADGYYSGNRKLGLLDGVRTHEYSLVSFSADGSLMRNYVGYSIARGMGLGVACRYVDLWVNGDYRGLYLLTEKNDSMAPEGGYALEFDNRPDPDQYQIRLPGLYGASGNGFITVKKNDNENEKETRYGTRGYGLIKSYLYDAWRAVNSDGDGYTKYFDVESWAKYYILQEFLKDGDNYGNTYMYLGQITKGKEPPKLKAGPIWDLDHGVALTSYMPLDYNIKGWYVQNRVQKRFWLDAIDDHADFAEEVEAQRLAWRDLFRTAKDVAAQCRDDIAPSAKMHFARWGKRLNYWSTSFAAEVITEDHYRYKATNGWEDYVDNLILFLKYRSRFIYNTVFTIEDKNR